MSPVFRSPLPPTPEERATLTAALGRKPRILTTARGVEQLAVACVDALCVGRLGRWRVTPWHEIQCGGWNQAEQILSWVLINGSHEQVQLTDSGQLPVVFMERVGASIEVQQQLDVPNGLGAVVIAGRRDLGVPDASLKWLVQTVGRTDLSDPRVREFVVSQTARMKAEFEA